MSTTTETMTQPTFGEIMDKAAKSALRGGTAGAVAMGLNVGALMWMRTTVRCLTVLSFFSRSIMKCHRLLILVHICVRLPNMCMKRKRHNRSITNTGMVLRSQLLYEPSMQMEVSHAFTVEFFLP